MFYCMVTGSIVHFDSYVFLTKRSYNRISLTDGYIMHYFFFNVTLHANQFDM